jgi:hypothetical protein
MDENRHAGFVPVGGFLFAESSPPGITTGEEKH